MNARSSWLEARRAGIGGSDAAALVACHPYHSLVSLWADKTGRIPPTEDNQRLRWGRRLEAAILDEYEHVTGRRVVDQREAVPHLLADIQGVEMLQHPDVGVAIGNADGFVEDETALTVIDGKTVGFGQFGEWISNGKPPLNYLVQLAHYQEITGAKWGTIAAFTGLDDPLYVYTQERDPDFGARLLEAEDTFWRRYVVPDKEPPADATKRTAEALRALHPKDNGKAVLLTGPAVGWAADHDDLGAEISRLKAERDGLATKLIATIGDASAGILPDGSGFTYKANKAGARSLRRAGAKALRKYET